MFVAVITNCPDTFHKVWRVELAFNRDCRYCSKQRNRSNKIVDLSERGIDSMDVRQSRTTQMLSSTSTIICTAYASRKVLSTITNPHKREQYATDSCGGFNQWDTLVNEDRT